MAKKVFKSITINKNDFSKVKEILEYTFYDMDIWGHTSKPNNKVELSIPLKDVEDLLEIFMEQNISYELV